MSRRCGALDGVLSCLLLAPYRCLDCRRRFFRPFLPCKPTEAPPQTPALAGPEPQNLSEASPPDSPRIS